MKTLFPTRRKVAVLIAGFITVFLAIPSSPSPAEAACRWTVKGFVFVRDNLFVTSGAKARPLKGAKATVWLSTINHGGWRKLGRTTINSAGKYSVSGKPAESGPIGCKKKRRIRVQVKLDNTIARVMRHPAPTAWNHTIRSTNKRSGPVISLGAYTYRFYDDKKPRTAVTRYTATKAATMFLAYQRVYRKLKSWDLKPKKANLLYPDGAGNNNYLGFSDPACCVKIARNWFSHNDRAWRVRELTHELVHQWFNTRVFTPGFISGKTFGTHDFLETTELTLYEEFAEFAAVELNYAIYGISNSGNASIRTRRGVYKKFRDATHGDPKVKYYKGRTLRSMVHGNTSKWRKDLYRSKTSVRNYLRLLTVKDWHWLDFGGSYRRGNDWAAAIPAAERSKYDCSRLRSPMFSPRRLMRLAKAWKDRSPNRKIRTPRGIKQFYDFLAARDSRFKPLKTHFLRLGNPHFAGKVSARDKCKLKKA